MPNQLHVVVRTPDEFSQELLEVLRKRPESLAEVIDLTQGTPDYRHLLDRIFACDSVAVW
ncbi:MAG: hypothetical protein J0M24_15860 [Verrucomicrobia bacterium]|nr:hypothetical protein [Verrucomicrobiota bacterium]